MLYNLKQLNILLTWNSLRVFIYLVLGPSIRWIQPVCDPYAVCTRVLCTVNCSGQSLTVCQGILQCSLPSLVSQLSASRWRGHQAICSRSVQGTRWDLDMPGPHGFPVLPCEHRSLCCSNTIWWNWLDTSHPWVALFSHQIGILICTVS